MKKDKRLRSFYCDDTLWIRAVEYADSRALDMDKLIERAIRTHVEENERGERTTRQTDDPTTQKFDRRESTDDVMFGRREEFPAGDSKNQVNRDTNKLDRDSVLTSTGAIPSKIREDLKLQLHSDRPRLKMQLEERMVYIDRERFVIGRSSKGTDFVIRDENVSRKHCAILFHSGHYYIQDLQSTNGTEYNGKRIELRRIDSGDIYVICDYELRFEIEDGLA